jgi:hypothetical protein
MFNPRLRSMGSDELQEHILSTYFSLRLGIAVIGLLFPFILWFGGAAYANLPLLDSMSQYYHQLGIDGRSMRNWFVGLLFIIGACLYLYKGYSRLENWLLNAGGLFCVGVALFPMPWPEGSGSGLSPHYICAVTFFLCIAAVALFCAGDTLPLVKNETHRAALKHSYRLVGIIMILSTLTAYLLGGVFHYAQRTFFMELAGVLSFGIYWALKTVELRHTEADCKAVVKKLTKTDGDGKVREVDGKIGGGGGS